MTKLSKDKKDKLKLTIIGIVGALGLLYTFVYSSQQDALDAYQRRIMTLQDRQYKNKKLVDRGPRIEEELSQVKGMLGEKESTMIPQGNHYIFFFKLVDEFRRKQGLGTQFIADMTQPEFSELGLLPRFPYKTAVFGVKLSGQYYEIGKFIADFENAHPYMRVQNVRIQPELMTGNRTQTGSQFAAQPAQKLIAEIQIVTLIRPGTS